MTKPCTALHPNPYVAMCRAATPVASAIVTHSPYSSTPQSSARRPSRNVYCISHVYGHHAVSSGYHRLGPYIGEVLSLSPCLRHLGNTVLRLPTKLIAKASRVYEYSRHSCIAEIGTALHLLRHRDAIYHFLYAEKGYRFSGLLDGCRGNRLVGSFHYPPSKFFQMVGSTHHIARLDHAIAVSTNQLELLESLVGTRRATFVPHGIDTTYWHPLPHRPPTDRRFQCVFAGYHMRDVDTLERIIDIVATARSDVDFVLLTKDPRCASLAERPTVRWLKRTSDEVYRAAIQQADLMVLPLTDSTAVNSVLEALACGVPVVTTQGGIGDYLTDACAVIHRVGDAESIADTVIDLVNDERSRADMSYAARAHACKLEWSNVAGRIRQVYASLA
jgi:glycosyltransferase involved in cell wall biosynthesis